MPSKRQASAATKDPDFVSALARGLRIFELFDWETPELTQAEVAQKTGLSAGATRRFLMTLKALGYMGTYGKSFLLRPKVLEIGFAYLNTMTVDEVLQPYLRELAQTSDCNCAVGVLEGAEVVFIAAAAMKRLVRLSAGVGARFPAHVTASGRILLAHRSSAALDEYFGSERLHKVTEATEVNPRRLRQILNTTRQKGFAVVRDELEIGIISVAIPLEDALGNVVAALTCASLSRGAGDEQAFRSQLELLHKFAAPISEALRRTSAFSNLADPEARKTEPREVRPARARRT